MPVVLKLHNYAEGKVIDAQKRGAIDIKLKDILGDDGTLQFLSDAQNRGLVEVRQSANKLHLKIGGVVGHMPLTRNLALNIHPKFPISNLSRMVEVSNQRLNRMANLARYYGNNNVEYLPEPLIRGFCFFCKDILETGMQKAYRATVSVGSPHPRIDFKQSQQRFWSKGNPLRAVSKQFLYDADIAANRILKTAALIALNLSIGRSGFEYERSILSSLLSCLSSIDPIDRNCLDLEVAIGQTASFRAGYRKALPLAAELIRNCSLDLSSNEQEIELPSFLLNLDAIFEAYVRNVLVHELRNTNAKGAIRDGNNAQWSKPLLRDSSKYKAKPDLVFSEENGETNAIGDVKYKGKQAESDRYQIISHAFAYGARRALLIYPATNKNPSGLTRLGAIGPKGADVTLYELFIPLEGSLPEEEKAFSTATFECLNILP